MTPAMTMYRSAYVLWLVILVGVARKINTAVQEPYMDEIFHVPQAQAYCRGEWKSWDGAITTPPGLYLVPALISRLRQNLLSSPTFSFDFCSLNSLRFFNLSILAALPYLYTSLLFSVDSAASESGAAKKVKPKSETEREAIRNSARWEGLVIALMPVVGWWGWLYYTDIGSVATVLLALRFSYAKRYFISSLLGATSLLFRQTNIAWVLFVTGGAIIRELRTHNSPKRKRSQLYDPLLQDARLIDLILTPYSLVYLSLYNIAKLVPILVAYLPIFVGFLAFIKLNGGIVLGDKSNHVATIHIPQIYYFVAFSAVLLSPHLLEKKKIKKTITSLTGTKTRIVTSLNILVVMCWTIRNFTIAHPFLLADNRHFAFYLWRRVINVHPLARYALTPAYLFATRLVHQALIDAQTMRLSTLLLFAFSTTLVLIPTPLIETRYFLTPFLVLRLYVSSVHSSTYSSSSSSRRRNARLLLEAVLYLIVQTSTIWLFLEKSFVWDIELDEHGKGLRGRDEREFGKRQRFMW